MKMLKPERRYFSLMAQSFKRINVFKNLITKSVEIKIFLSWIYLKKYV